MTVEEIFAGEADNVEIRHCQIRKHSLGTAFILWFLENMLAQLLFYNGRI